MDIKNKVVNFLSDEEGLTVVEYVLGAALLVVALGTIFSNLGTGLSTSLNTTIGKVNTP